MAYKITAADAAKLKAMVWLKTSASKQEKPAPTFKPGTIVNKLYDKTKLEVLSSLGAYTLVLNTTTQKTDVVSSFDLIKSDEDPQKGIAALLRHFKDTK